MAKHFHSYQFDMPYRSTYLRNWEVPKNYCPKPRRRLGTTLIISNSRGHLLPGAPRSPCNPFGDFIGTWQMPIKITREIANKMNGLADKKAFYERCRVNAAITVRTKQQKETRTSHEENKKILEEPKPQSIEDVKHDEVTVQSDLKEVEGVTKLICPIHDF